MEQRPLRLGDIVDDYCPRERRLTNHAIVAVVGDAIQQTRCTTCEADHPYKEGKVPRRKKKDPAGELYDEVLAGVTGQLVTRAPEDSPNDAEPPVAPAAAVPQAVAVAPHAATNGAAAPEKTDKGDVAAASSGVVTPAEPAPADANGADDFWPAHRRLIRATLPKVEGQQPLPRPIPEFTMRQQGGRSERGFRGGGGGGQSWNDRGGQPSSNGHSRGGGGGQRHGKFGGGGRPPGQGGGGGRPHRPGGGGRPKGPR